MGEMQEMLDGLIEESEKSGLKVNIIKTKVMSNTTEENLGWRWYGIRNDGGIYIPKSNYLL